MKLILTQEVAGLGAPGDVVEVKDGYGRNYLVPRGLAIRWTRGGEKQVDSIQRAREAREIRDLGQAERGQGPARGAHGQAAGPRRRRRPAVRLGHRRPTSSRPSKAPAARTSTSAGSRSATPIKTVGAHQVTVRLHPEVTATLDRRGRPRGLTRSTPYDGPAAPQGVAGPSRVQPLDVPARPGRRPSTTYGRRAGTLRGAGASPSTDWPRKVRRTPEPVRPDALSPLSGPAASVAGHDREPLDRTCRRPPDRAQRRRRSGRPRRRCWSTTGPPCCGSAAG